MDRFYSIFFQGSSTHINQSIMTRSDQPEPPAVANGLSSAYGYEIITKIGPHLQTYCRNKRCTFSPQREKWFPN